MAAAVATSRAAVPDDEPFLREVYRSGRAAEFAALQSDADRLQAFLDWQYDLQARSYGDQFPEVEIQVICCNGVDAGRLIRAPFDGGILVADIGLLPEFRNCGLGTQVIVALQEEARAASAKVFLQVEIGNPALALYQRLGFRVMQSDPVRIFMEWSAPA